MPVNRPVRRPAGRGLRRGRAGYALLEALIAVVVTSIGFIGAARLQTMGSSFNASAGMRQRATLLVNQMTDRMRANSVGMASNAYDKPAAGAVSCLSTSSGCSPSAMAGADMSQWLADVAAQLPGGTGTVCIDSTPDDGTAAAPACDGIGLVYAVKVWWLDKARKSDTARFVTTARPTS